MTTGADGSTGRRVYTLSDRCTVEDLEPDTQYVAEVNGVVPYGIFVDVADGISGLVHESNLKQEYQVGDEVVVTLEAIQENGDVAFDVSDVEATEVVSVSPTTEPTRIADIEIDAEPITVEGRVDQIKQTGGPTIFSVSDGANVLECAAFEAAGVRAYPKVETSDLVRLHGIPETRGEGLQLEVNALEVLSAVDAKTVRDRVDERTVARAGPDRIDFLVDWDELEALRGRLEALATDLRRMIIESRPVRIRHHADGDGMCAAVPLVVALERFAQDVHADPSVTRYLVSRSPSRAPYYEMEDATRDLNRALEDRERHGQRLPMLLMLDNGSTAEDVPAYRNLAHYDIPIAVVDHHHPDVEAVQELLSHHVNPYLVDEDYRMTTGMLCVELARMIDPDPTPELRHVPAVAGIADRSEAGAMEAYLSLAAEAGYDTEGVTRIGEALDYASHWLKYSAGSGVVRDVLGVDVSGGDRHDALVSLLSSRARAAIAEQLDAALPHVTTETLANGAELHRLDVDAYAHRFRYPAPGKTTGAVHDHKAGDSGEPTITIGYGPDFCVMRSDGVRLDIPTMVEELREELPGGGVQGGGHLVVGSVKFVPGKREAVLDPLVEKMGAAPLDAELTSTGPLPETDA